MANDDKTDIRFVQHNSGAVYLRKEDVVQYIRDNAEDEETDTRNRFQKMAENLSEVGNEGQ